VHVEIAIGLFEDMREDARLAGFESGSPVESGRFSASMRVSADALDMSNEFEDPAHVRGTPRSIQLTDVSAFRARMQSYRLGQKIFISNSVPYASALEFEGKSKYKTPRGIMGVTIRRFRSKWRVAMYKAKVGSTPF
jgi:hypothetical protein